MIKIEPNTNRIVSFGCWNQLQTDEGSSLKNTQVMATLKRRQVDMVLVSGDNYYPVKKKIDGEKVKTIILENLIDGFNNLKAATRTTPVFMNFGNHDVIKNGKMGGASEQECTILNEEMRQATDNINLKMNHRILYGDHTLVLMLDTTIYSPKKEFDKDFNVCYQQISGYDVNIQKRLQDDQYTFVQESLASFDGPNIIIVGHYPIIYMKTKSNKMVKKLESSVEFTDLLMLLPSEKSLYYLCADYHLYEEGNIQISDDSGKTIMIHQFITGTGGTELNSVEFKPRTFTESQISKSKQKDYAFNYELLNTEHRHGFIEGKYNDGWTFNFILISRKLNTSSKSFRRFIVNASSAENRRRKTRRARVSAHVTQLKRRQLENALYKVANN
jgi:hypothetical protein